MYGRPAQPAHLIHLQFLFLNRELNWFHFSCPGWRLQWVLGRSIGSHHFWLEFLSWVLWQGKRGSFSTSSRAGKPLAWITRSCKDLKSAGYLTAFPEAQARPVLAPGGGIVQFWVPRATAVGHCLTPHTHPSPLLEARLPRVKRQPLHSRTSVPSCLLPGEWIAGRCRAGSVAQGHLPFVSLHFVLS